MASLSLEKIKAPIADEIERYELYLRDSLGSDSNVTSSMLDYVFENRGKGVRPTLVLLSAGLYTGGQPLPEATRLGAMLVEMIHTASLVHDDVIDEALIRRGKPSIKAVWQSRKAVIIGDYILAKSFSVGMESGYYEVVRYISGIVTNLCEGELLQSRQSELLEMTREIYLDIIYKKTASLLAVCAGAGALSAGAPEKGVETMSAFGRALGMAFQIKDDILDYSPSADTGKPHCGDLREKKITLPLLTVLENSPREERRRITALLSEMDSRPANVETLYDIVLGGGGLEAAGVVMNGYVSQALDILSAFPASPCRDSLAMLCDYVATRKM